MQLSVSLLCADQITSVPQLPLHFMIHPLTFKAFKSFCIPPDLLHISTWVSYSHLASPFAHFC